MTTTDSSRLILITGAAGVIGSYFAKNADKQKYKLRLMVHPSNPPEEVESLKLHGEVVEAELGQIETLMNACEGVDTILHLAGQPDPNARWDSLLKDNIEGTYNIFLTAKKSNVKRVIYASSIHAISGYPIDTQVKTTDPVKPGDLYGVTKCFGEALGCYMGEQEGLSTIAIRIGAFQPYSSLKDDSKTGLLLDAWLSQPDAVQLFEKCIDAPANLKFAIVHGLSNNTFKRMDVNSTRVLLGYDPQDNFYEAHENYEPLNIRKTLRLRNMKDPLQTSGLRDKSPE
ncbi:unnamed protein product [Didymodactylos carnosus]|uniref:NAD-dependent epimerase/dehydratase domain-containing protein n=1 Tax=Didymodactylos carnosus TaxID=1234261 RepID=A0A816AKP3_9BILA|nr:unnamed protein product [Didymodactylos carnosus]CAF1596828.1 unnamed protein product [Didymodactylos carnosus]CAF4170105.1 unnamed protein product [Didymodactylos carnosus]CAF4471905.1 unnamed protein product [Didymodactylos carnosus]